MEINFKKDTLPFDGFNFGGKSYCREIKDIKPNARKNGFALIGDFVEKKKPTTLDNGKLYLCVSRGGEKEKTHLFTIENNKPVLINDSDAQKKVVEELWDDIVNFIANRPKKTNKQLADYVVDAVGRMDNERLYEIANMIVSQAKERDDIHQKFADENFQRGMRMLQLEKGCYPFQINPWTEMKKETDLGKEFEDFYEKGRFKKGGFIDKWKIHEIHRI